MKPRFLLFPFLILAALIFNNCEVPTEYEDDDNNSGVLDNVNLRFIIYVRNANTNSPISQAVVQWDPIYLGVGSIVYPTSGTTDNEGKIDVMITNTSGITSYNLNIIRVYSPSGSYNGLTPNLGLQLRENSIASYTFYLTPL
jgi:hypothetical protein